MATGRRIYFNQFGTIITIANEIENLNIERPEEVISYIDIPFGGLNLSKSILIGVDVENGTVITEPLDIPETGEQRRIRELEDALLLQADNDLGGIL